MEKVQLIVDDSITEGNKSYAYKDKTSHQNIVLFELDVIKGMNWNNLTDITDENKFRQKKFKIFVNSIESYIYIEKEATKDIDFAFWKIEVKNKILVWDKSGESDCDYKALNKWLEDYLKKYEPPVINNKNSKTAYLAVYYWVLHHKFSVATGYSQVTDFYRWIHTKYGCSEQSFKQQYTKLTENLLKTQRKKSTIIETLNNCPFTDYPEAEKYLLQIIENA